MLSRYIFAALVLFSQFCSAQTNQQPAVQIKSFEYLYDVYNKQRIILMKEPEYQSAMKKSFTKALHQVWGVDVPDFEIEMKKDPGMVYRPKFDRKLKKPDAGIDYAFIEVHDKGTSVRWEPREISSQLVVRIKVIAGRNDSLLQYKKIYVNIKSVGATNQVLLNLLPGDPAEYISLYDSIALWALTKDDELSRTIIISPACLYDSVANVEPLRKISDFALLTDKVKVEEAGKKKNFASNSVAGALTLLTGIGTEKRKTFKYKSTHLFIKDDDTISVIIPYSEDHTAERERITHDDGYRSLERSDYAFSERSVDKDRLNVITAGTDTIGSFKFDYKWRVTSTLKMWNGKDTSTIKTLPAHWNSLPAYEMDINGQFGTKSFTMTTMDNRSIKKFMIDGKPVLAVFGTTKPEAWLYKDADETELKLMYVISKLSDHYGSYQGE